MDDCLPIEEYIGRRAESVCGFLLIFPVAIILIAAGIVGSLLDRGIADLLLVAAGLGLLVAAADFLIRSIRPNRLRLDAEGLYLMTWRATTRWPWSAYRGLGGFEARLLRVETATGKVRLIPIGYWSPGIDRRLHDHATRAGVSLPEPSPRPRPASPMVLVACLLLVVALLVAWVDLSR